MSPLITIDRLVDARGLACPMPILKTAQAIKEVPPGAAIEVLATDPGSVKDVAAWCKTTGHELVEQIAESGVFHFIIRRT